MTFGHYTSEIHKLLGFNEPTYAIPWDLIIGDDYDVVSTKELINLATPESKHEIKLNNFWNKYCSNR